jgi:cell division protein FtsW
MLRSAAVTLLLVLPALALGALGLAVVATAPAHTGPAGFGAPHHFAIRQIASLVVAALLGFAAARAGLERCLHAAPVILVVALAATAAVFVPGVGVRAAGASRWLRLGPISGNPAPLLIGAVALLLAAASPRRAASRGGDRQVLATWIVAVIAALVAIVVLVAEPDFSAAGVTLTVGLAALAGGGLGPRRLIPAAALLAIVLFLGASRFGYVGGRIQGFLAPHSDRHGKGFEVLTLAHAKATQSSQGVGLGHGITRRHLSSPASDYVFAVVNEELGRRGALAVLGAWTALGCGIVFTARAARGNPAARALAFGVGAALLAPAALHVAVSRGWIPIIGVSMPLLSYDPGLTVASGGEIGLLAGIALGGGLRSGASAA